MSQHLVDDKIVLEDGTINWADGSTDWIPEPEPVTSYDVLVLINPSTGNIWSINTYPSGDAKSLPMTRKYYELTKGSCVLYNSVPSGFKLPLVGVDLEFKVCRGW